MVPDGPKGVKRQVLPIFDGLGPTHGRWRVVAAQGGIGAVGAERLATFRYFPVRFSRFAAV